ncbi:MAG: DinB family protein [bacterium]
MSEKEMFLNTWNREFATTLKILKQLPAEKSEFKPVGEKNKTAKELATVFIAELGVVEGVVRGKIDFGGQMPVFATYNDILTTYESTHKAMVPKVTAMSEADWNSKITAPVGPKQMGEVRRADMLWMMLMDSVHHRGQFSIYLRMVGAKVPSIYGPSGDEPWN